MKGRIDSKRDRMGDTPPKEGIRKGTVYGPSPSPKARAHDWRRNPLTLKEVEVFLALIIAMGICGFPTLRYMACMTQNSSAMFYAVMHILVHDIHIMVMMFLTRMKRGQSCMVHITIYIHVISTSVHVCARPRNTACSHIHVSTTCLYIE